MGAAIKGYNTVVEIKDSAGVYKELAKCKQSDIFKGSNASEDVTHMRSTGRHTETVPTLRTTAPLKLDLIYDSTDPTHSSTSTEGFPYLLASADIRNLRFTLSNGKQFVYNGFVAEFEIGSANPNNIIMASAVFQPSEAPVSGI